MSVFSSDFGLGDRVIITIADELARGKIVGVRLSGVSTKFDVLLEDDHWAHQTLKGVSCHLLKKEGQRCS